MTLIDDAAAHAVHAPMRVHGSNIDGGDPPAGAGRPSTPGSTKVAWTVRQGDSIVAVFDFAINPQGLTRVESSRAQMFATKGGFYVDDFGPGAAQITLRQIVASGHWISTPRGLREVLTLREDVQRFYETIWKPATRPVNQGRLKVFFHDNHFEQGHDEQVFFPPNGLSLQRSVDLQDVWLLELQMTSLEVRPLSDIDVTRTSNKHNKKYVVKTGDTLHSIAVKLAGKNASAAKVRHVLARILDLNPTIRQNRTLKLGSTGFVGDHTVKVKAMHLAPGEVIVLPTAAASTDAPVAISGHVQK